MYRNGKEYMTVGDLWNSFWSFVWIFFWSFVFIAYLFALWSIIADLFRDRELKGIWKAVWLVFLIFAPFLTALIYLVGRGSGMAQRSLEHTRAAQGAADDYIRSVAGASPTEEIAKAKDLLDAGTITQDEYEKIKLKALS